MKINLSYQLYSITAVKVTLLLLGVRTHSLYNLAARDPHYRLWLYIVWSHVITLACNNCHELHPRCPPAMSMTIWNSHQINVPGIIQSYGNFFYGNNSPFLTCHIHDYHLWYAYCLAFCLHRLRSDHLSTCISTLFQCYWVMDAIAVVPDNQLRRIWITIFSLSILRIQRKTSTGSPHGHLVHTFGRLVC